MDCIGKGICHPNKKNLKSGLEISKSFAETDQLFMVQKSGEPVDMVFIRVSYIFGVVGLGDSFHQQYDSM